MMQDISKEIKYGMRNSRFLILIIGLLFFAISIPVMTKVVLPGVLQSQFPGMSMQDLSAMLNMTQLGCMQSYMGDVYEIGSLIVAFTLCGLLAQEIKDNTLILPLCSGKRFGGIIGSKMLVFGTVLLIAPLLALLIDYVYAGILFSFDIGVMAVIRGGLLQGVYMVFLLAMLMMWGALIKKPIAAGFLTLGVGYGLSVLGSTLDIKTYLPTGLLDEAIQLSAAPSSSLILTLGITVGIIALCIAVTWLRLKKMELYEK